MHQRRQVLKDAGESLGAARLFGVREVERRSAPVCADEMQNQAVHKPGQRNGGEHARARLHEASQKLRVEKMLSANNHGGKIC